jgi:hypothetical protein
MYKVFGGRENIEFITIFPEKERDERFTHLPRDIGIAVSTERLPENDIISICRERKKLLEHIGIADMSFLRKMYEILSVAHRE